jgi:hypothetical protein
MAKLSGWQKAGVIAGVGCFSIVAVVLVGVAVAVVWARSTISQLGDTTPTTVERTIPVGNGAGGTTAAVPPAADRSASTPAEPGASFTEAPLTLDISLQEGNFTIEPGPPGPQVRVHGTFAPGLYELVETHDANARRSTIRFRSRAPMWARILSGIVDGNDNDANRPELTVVIPSGTPMDLNLAVSMGESRIDLGGLALGEVDLDVSMGEHRIDFGTPLTGGMRRLRVDASMGEVAIENIGNARPRSVETSASMGSLTADLGGAWQAGSDAALSFTSSMGELTLRVPSGVRLDADIRDAEGRARNPASSGTNPQDPNAPLLKLRVENSMGETRVVRY